jgi:hypothetical protein
VTTTSTPPTTRKTIRDIGTVRRVVISLLLCVAAGALYAGGHAHHDVRPGALYPAAIAAVYPKPGTPSVERQTTVFAELRPGYDGDLAINSHHIPDDQMQKLSTGNTRLAFTPGPGKDLTSFPPDRNCVTLRYWHNGESPESGNEYSWCFNLG